MLSTPGRAVINADKPAREATIQKTVPLNTPTAHNSPARVNRGATRMTCTISGPGDTKAASQIPIRVRSEEMVMN